MYQKWLREAGYWLPRVNEGCDASFMYRGMSYQLKRALQCFMEEECV